MKSPMKGDIPTARQGHSAILHGLTMWVFGGVTTSSYSNELFSFNLETVSNYVLYIEGMDQTLRLCWKCTLR